MQVRLVAWYVVALIGGSILFQILFALLGIVNGASGGLAAIMAAMIPGHVYSRRTGAAPSVSFSWRMALWFSLTGAVVSVLPLLLFGALGDSQLAQIVTKLDFWLIMAGFTLFFVPFIRFMFGLAARTEAKKASAMLARPSERDSELARLKGLLAALEAIPAHRRADELADERAEEVRALIASASAQ